MARENNSAFPVKKQSEIHADSSVVWLRINAFLSLKSANTQRTYLAIIKEWCTFLGAEAGSSEAQRLIISAQDIHAIAYKAWLEKQPGQSPRYSRRNSPAEKSISTERHKSPRDGTQSSLSNATIAKKFAALRRIYRMLLAYDLGIQHNPFDTDRVPAPRARSGQKRPTEMIEAQRVLEMISIPDASTEKGLRDKTLLAVLFAGGLRRSEIVKLKLGDVRQSESGLTYLRLRATKAGTDANQALPLWAGKLVQELRAMRERDHGAGSGDALFVGYRGHAGTTRSEEALSDSGLYKLFKKYCSLAGVQVPASPHSARATAITRLLSDGVPHREVQEFSRHASVQMVEAYDKRRLTIEDNPGIQLRYDREN